MTRSIRLAVLALVAVAVLALAGIAYAAYTTPSLKVTQVGSQTAISVTQDQSDDATARASIYAPAGTVSTLNQAPGTKIGTVTATVVALALGGALLPLTGEILVAPPGAIPAASQAACIQSATPTASWLMVLQAAGQTLNVPMYLVTTQGAETAYGPVKIVVCLPPPDVPVAVGGATFGAKLFQATFIVNGIFAAVPSGQWLSIWSPYTPLVGQVNAAGSVASPSGIASGSLSVKVAKVGLVKSRLVGKLTQGGTAVGGANVQIWAGLTKAGLKQVATVKTSASGNYTFAYGKAAKFFRTRTVVGASPAPALCTKLQPALPVPCINATTSAFTALSAITKR